MAAEHGVFRPPDYWEHNNRRYLIRIVPPVPDLWNCFVHSPCVCNEIVAARNRVLGEVPVPTKEGLALVRYQMKRMAEKIGHKQAWTLEQVLESFKGARKRRYQDAYDSLARLPLDAGDARIQAFVKAEKFDPNVKINPDPRMIQARSPRYNLVIAKYLRPIEHSIYNLVGKDGLRVVAKGLNQVQRAELIKEKWALFDEPVCVSLDCSRFDKHVNLEMLKIEHSLYTRVHPGQPELDRLLKWQQRNKCRTAGGVKYTTSGGRMSGDINTALGNCVIMILQAMAGLKKALVKRYSLLDDGDDLLLFLEKRDLERVLAMLPELFRSFGQEVKVENIAHRLEDIVFCQARMVHNGIGNIMVRDWRKVLSQACSGTRHWNDPRLVRPMAGLVGRCELALNSGVPVLQAYSQALIRISGGETANLNNIDTGLAARMRAEFGEGWEDKVGSSGDAATISDVARHWFEEAFGVEEWRQVAIENILKKWDLTTTECTTLPEEWDHTWEDRTSLAVHIPKMF